ncbi:MAG: sulfatase-like hydrolase/transferase [Planctomycetaceae bacterium]|nr:sulfatase-like hydrolase/transferase [Planctomycetaceae bacterium]
MPEEYFKPFPLESIQLPLGYREDDLMDLPAEGQRRGPNRYFEHILKQGQWKQGIQGYLASIHFADAMLGKVLDALEAGPHVDNTIVVLWSDHGWHLGEKQHWQKYTGWRVCTRVPLMVRVPPGTPGLESGTVPGVCEKPVNLLSLFPTLLVLCGLPAEAQHDGPSLTPLLGNPQTDWPHCSITYLGDPGSYALSEDRWRLIHYANGEEELYDIPADRYEWNNLANDSGQDQVREALRARAPASFVPKPAPSVASLPQLKWNPLKEETAPPSRPDGNTFDIVLINSTEQPVALFWMNREGEPLPYGTIPAGKQKRQQTRPGAVWLIRSEAGEDLGYFRVDDRAARAIVPGE